MIKISDLKRALELVEERNKLKQIVDCPQVVVGNNISNNVIAFRKAENPTAYDAIIHPVRVKLETVERELHQIGVDCSDD